MHVQGPSERLYLYICIDVTNILTYMSVQSPMKMDDVVERELQTFRDRVVSGKLDIIDIAIRILEETDGDMKSAMTVFAVEHALQQERYCVPVNDTNERFPPSVPGRDPRVEYVTPNQLPRRGRGGSLASRQALLHSLVHIECCAIDLAWDAIARFHWEYKSLLPLEFYKDFMIIASDEARHYRELRKRLNDNGMDYGDLAVHDGLWDSAMATSGTLPGRLAVEHCTHEARGLDVLPQTIQRFKNGNDHESAKLLESIIYPEEISHCAAGVKWLRFLYDEAQTMDVSTAWVREAQESQSVAAFFHSLVRRHFHGPLKPPFNDEARSKAGFTKDWYMPLATVELH